MVYSIAAVEGPGGRLFMGNLDGRGFSVLQLWL